ncbi:PLP-dependent aminotransferase family protein [Candidatus Leptofilum sp.]|uniref:MocR-like pyridoxine biosynthesis transcription factor PdxR n=1 Tax=Candidatus Leptofilum sp. TaxID=3241576 RepID=UPI003B5BC6CD
MPQRTLPNTFYLSLVTVDPAAKRPLYRQIYQGLRDAITDGRLEANTKLPSTRDLAAIWGVSRNTLRNAFDQLIAEGYLEAAVGHGTFVVEQRSRITPPPIPTERVRPISRIGEALEPLGRSLNQILPGGTAFAIGAPGLDIFPYKVWNRFANRCLRRNQQLDTHFYGMRSLREAIASYLTSARGLHCLPEQIIIVPGAVSGILVATLALLNPGDQVWMEEPGYINASGLVRYRGADLIPVPVDEDGLNVKIGLAKAPAARLAYVTPSHQYPLGVTMSLARRQQLLAWAAQQNAWILEDDYDSVFHYDGSPLVALQGLDTQQRVIYIGTFSKVLLPGLRVGYVVLPPDLVDVFGGVKLPMSINSATIVQATIAEFMLEGHFVRHIRRMQKQYRARRDALVEAVEHHLAGAITLGEATCGMHVAGFLDERFDETAVLTKARKVGMGIAPLSREYFAQPKCQGLMMGFTNVPPDEIEGYIAKLAATIF